MSQSAKVTSVEALKQFHGVMIGYEEAMHDGLSILLLEVRRGLDWLEHDRPQYWRKQLRKAQESVTEARQALERKELTIDHDSRPSCYDEKAALEKAKRRLRYVEEKIETVKTWIQVARHEAEQFETHVARMGNVLDTDLSRAIAAMKRMLDALGKYSQSSELKQAEPSIQRSSSTPTNSDTDSMSSDSSDEE